MEQQIRQNAIERYLKGESPKSIYTDLKRSKDWFFKWLKRYKSGEPHWYEDKSRAPINRPTEISKIDRQRIISVRTDLESQRFAQAHPFVRFAPTIELRRGKRASVFPSILQRFVMHFLFLAQNRLNSKTRDIPYGIYYKASQVF